MSCLLAWDLAHCMSLQHLYNKRAAAKGVRTTNLDVDALREDTYACKTVRTHKYEGTTALPSL